MKNEITLPTTVEECHKVIIALADKIESISRTVEWFKAQTFGSTSERRIDNSNYSTAYLPGLAPTTQEPIVAEVKPEEEVRSQTRKRRSKVPIVDGAGVSGLRFSQDVHIEVVDVDNPAIAGLTKDQYEIIGYEETDKLAQRKSYYIKRFLRATVKLLDSGTIHTAPTPPAVIPGSFADVSFLAGLIVDKIIYHLPLYRSYQRLEETGIYISRATLTNYVHNIGDLLEVIFHFHLRSVLNDNNLTVDETRIKAGVDPFKHQMKTGQFWVVGNQKEEYVFIFYEDRGHDNVEKILGEWKNGSKRTLLTDDYGAYTAFADKAVHLIHALCWSHCRRYFIKCEKIEPDRVKETLRYFRKIYYVESEIRKLGLSGDQKRDYRKAYSSPLVEELFRHLETELNYARLLPGSPYAKAIRYLLDNKKELRVFLDHPEVAIDTNHLERQNKMVAIGRKNYLFCSSELGAHYMGIFYSLLLSAKQLGLNPREYLTDVLNRIASVPTEELHHLTPLGWKNSRVTTVNQ